MHIKGYNGFEIKYPGPDLYQDEIRSLMSFLEKEIEEIEDYPEKSLFFQNPQIIEAWLQLVRIISKIEFWGIPEDDTEWENRTETYVAYLLTLRDLHQNYQNLYRLFYNPLKKLLDGYGEWLEGKCVSSESLEALISDQYEQDLEGVEDISLFIEQINNNSHKARFAIYDTLSDILTLLLSVMNRGGQKVIDMNPSIEDFARAIEDDLKEWTYSFGKSIFEDMKENLTRHFKEYRTAPYTPELWGEMLSADESALLMASKQQLASCDAVKQEHWGEDMRLKMDENGELMYLIYSSCRTERLFDLRRVDSSPKIISLLTPDNLSMFYDIIVRRNLIQCEMFPELKEKHEEWLNGAEENKEEDSGDDSILSNARQSKLNEIIEILQNGNWKEPATTENITLLLKTIFGQDFSLLDEGDESHCEEMWTLVEGGGGDRMVIVPANLAGLFNEENLLKGSPSEISNDLFGNTKQVNNINKGKGKPNNCSKAFMGVRPFIKKYIDKIIRQI